MARKARTEMIEETRQKLVAAARLQFGNVGYAETVMDDLTAQAGLTRGALAIKRGCSWRWCRR